VGWKARSGAARAPERGLIAVLPFRISADPSLDYLREGMLDLLGARLGGEVGTAVVDPGTLLREWRRVAGGADLSMDEAVLLAGGLGAGQLLLGEIVSVPPHLVLTARLLDTRDGSLVHQTAVEGLADSLPTLVDRLAGQLLLLRAGEEEHRLAAMTTASLPALRSYLLGQTSFREGRVEEALNHYLRALELDSAFVHAALGAWSTAIWGFERADERDRIGRLAWAGRDRLGNRDRLHLLALSGPDWPDPSTAQRRLDAVRRALSAAPDRAELWYHYGDLLTHDGARLGIVNARDEAIAAFERASELAPMTTEAIIHLLDLLTGAGDTARARAHGEAFLAETDSGEVPSYLRWLMAAATMPRADAAAVKARTDPLSWRINRWLVSNGQLLGGGLERDAEQALSNLRGAAQPPGERLSSIRQEIAFLLNAGRPADAERALSSFAELLGPSRAGVADRWRIYAALYWDGSMAAATRAADALARRPPPAPDDPDAVGMYLLAQCALGQWRIAQGRLDGTAGILGSLGAAAPPLHPDDMRHARFCAALLDALEREAAGGDAGVLADGLAAAFQEQLPYFSYDLLFTAAPLVIARLREARGDLDAALAWARRRPGAGSTQHLMLSTFLREEGRLSAVAGQPLDAARALAHYLELRARPESALADDVAAARRALTTLTAQQ
jgi:tetratricopeptide (TPR) repeat protein